MTALSLNDRAAALTDALIADASALNIGVAHSPGGETLVDCGHRHPGGTEAGLRLARICMAGLAEVTLVPSGLATPPWAVMIRTSQPVLACLASQYAGWHLGAAMGSGPARALARTEPLFDDIPHREESDHAVLLLEGDDPPDADLAIKVAEACRLPRGRLTLLHAPTGSPAGMVQIAARVLECAVQKARVLGFPLDDLREALGTAPVAPPHPDTRTAMGRANDAIIYGGRVELRVTGPADRARALARDLPSRTSPDWGRGFAEVYEAAGHDFARIDPKLFSPAEVRVTALDTGDTFVAGRTDPDRLAALARPDPA
jgi:methenyltetrahydromethanopterin cyclohydrolase